MLLKLLLLLTVVPGVELLVILEVGGRIGSLNTLGLIILTGVVGAYLARREGMGVIRRLRSDVGRGEVPTQSLMEGASILAGGLLLLTPGFLTDVLGFSLILPPTRRLIIAVAERRIRRWLDIQYTEFEWRPRR